jgi:hypothetical protein
MRILFAFYKTSFEDIKAFSISSSEIRYHFIEKLKNAVFDGNPAV